MNKPAVQRQSRLLLPELSELFNGFSGFPTFANLRALVRSGASDEELHAAIGRVWTRRADRYSEIRSERTTDLPRVEMSYIGG